MIKIKIEAKKFGLDATKEFWDKDDATLAMMIGGCGPGWIGNLGLFDRAFDVYIKPACGIHDFDYGTGETKKEKRTADFRLLCNSLKIVNQKSSGLEKIFAQCHCMVYYLLVANFGGKSFKKATL